MPPGFGVRLCSGALNPGEKTSQLRCYPAPNQMTNTEIIKRAALKKSERGTEEPPLVKWLLIALALAFCFVFLLLPLVNVFAQALAKGFAYYWNSLADPD